MREYKYRITILLILLITLMANCFPAAAAVSKPAIPKIKLATSVKKEYATGEYLKAAVQVSGYTGKVDYSVSLVRDSGTQETQTYLQVSGKSKFNFSRLLYEEGRYKLVVKVKRTGTAAGKLANTKENCDSYVTTAYFNVKNKQVKIEKSGSVYGYSNPKDDKGVSYIDLTINAKGAVCRNLTIKGDVYVNSDNVTLKGLHIWGTLYINPGVNATAAVEGVSADKIVILSGKSIGYKFQGVTAQELTYNSNNPMTVTAAGKTNITKTVVNKNVTLLTDNGSFGKVYLNYTGKSFMTINLNGSFPNPVTVQSDALINTASSTTTVSEIQISPAGNKQTNVQLNGNFNNVNILNPSMVSLLNSSSIWRITSYKEAYLYIADGAKAVNAEAKNNAYAALLVSGNGKIENESGYVQRLVDSSELPKASEIINDFNAEAYLGYQYEKNSSGQLTYQPYYRLRLTTNNGAGIPTDFNKYVYLRSGSTVTRQKNNTYGNIYSFKVNKSDGTLSFPGGSNELYIPADNGKWYLVRFTTRQVGSGSEPKSELVSVNGKPHVFKRWKAPASTKNLSYVTVGTVLNDVVKILGNPSKKYAYTEYSIYQYNKNYSTPSYIYLDKIDGNLIVQGWENNTQLKISIGSADPKAPPFKLYSSKQEVIKAMGTPDRLDIGGDYEIWGYKGSTITLNDDRVVSYKNTGNLKVSIGSKLSNATPISLSSTRQDVVNAMGTPTEISYGDAYNLHECWYYGKSSIGFNPVTGLVERYYNDGSLNVSIGTRDPEANPFTLGATKEEVLKANGTPKSVGDYWTYDNNPNKDDSVVYFDDSGRVSEFTNSGELNVSFGTIDPSVPGLELGQNREQVVKSNGTPTRARLEWDGGNYWSYGGSDVYFDKEGKVTSFNNYGNLKIGYAVKEPAASGFYLGASMTDVAKAQGAPDGARKTGSGYEWTYKQGRVSFDNNGTVYYFINLGGLNVSTVAKDPSAAGFTIGSTRDEVVSSNGAPSSASGSLSGGGVMYYGQSRVEFDSDGKVKAYDNNGELKVFMGDKDPSVKTFYLGASIEEVIKFAGTPAEYMLHSDGTFSLVYEGASVSIRDGKVDRISGIELT